MTCRDMPVQRQHFHQTRARNRCGDYGVHRKGDACLGRYYCYRLWFVSSCTRGRSRISRANRCFLQAAVLLNAVERRGIASKKNDSIESCGIEMAWGQLILSSSNADGRAWAKAAAGTVGRRVGVERHRVVTFTTLRASARRTGQTAYLIAAFGRIKMAHPDLLFDLLRRNRVSMSRWMMRHWLSHPRR